MFHSGFTLMESYGDRIKYTSESVPANTDKVLDIGCGYGWALGLLKDKAIERWGIDSDEEALQKAGSSHKDVKFILQTGTSLPFADSTFNVVILSDVIEHVGDANKQLVINEAWRVLKTDGLFIFTAPYNGLFSWADHLDFKRRFSAIYKTYMWLSGYTPQTPVEIGHKHLSLDEIEQLFSSRFEIYEMQFSGLITPFINWINVIGTRLNIIPKILRENLNQLQAWESGIQYPRQLAYNIRLKAYKIV